VAPARPSRPRTVRPRWDTAHPAVLPPWHGDLPAVAIWRQPAPAWRPSPGRPGLHRGRPYRLPSQNGHNHRARRTTRDVGIRPGAVPSPPGHPPAAAP